MANPRILYYSSRYLPRSQRYIWQQIRDLANTEVATLERLPSASEFPHEALTQLRPKSQVLRSVDLRWRTVAKRLAGRDAALTPMETIALQRRLRHADVAYAFFLTNAIDMLPAARATSTPLIAVGGGYDLTTATSRGERYLRDVQAVFDYADLVLCSSEFLRNKALELGCPPQKCEPHYFGIDLPDLHESAATVERGGTRPFSIAAVSRLHPVKGLDYTIKAFAKAFAGKHAILTIAGDGPELRNLEQLAIDQGVQSQVNFLGERSHEEVYWLLRHSDVFVQHSITVSSGEEGLGGSILEAAAHRLPVIATKSGGIPEAMIDGTTGFLVEERDSDAMAAHLLELANDAALRTTLGLAARSFVEESHESGRQNQRLQARVNSVVRANNDS